MPHGRHRHSPPLHRLLPPTTIAAVAVLGFGATWLSTQALVLRGLAALIAVAALVGCAVMRRWDSVAGLRVAELNRARGSDEWRHEERVAELETELEESRELRTRLAGRLRAKRAELSALRNEHAALLRRYATAETERASALEGRRRLAIEAATPTRALPAAGQGAVRPETPPAARRQRTGEHAPAPAARVSADLYARANAALDRFAPPSAPAEASAREAGPAAARTAPIAPTPTDSAYGDSAPTDSAYGDSTPAVPADGVATGVVSAGTTAPAGPTGSAAPVTHSRPQVAAAAAVAPAPPVRRRAAQGGFDFFGTQTGAPASADRKVIEAVQHEDLADVVGQETAAEARRAERERDGRGGRGERGERERPVVGRVPLPAEQPVARDTSGATAEPRKASGTAEAPETPGAPEAPGAAETPEVIDLTEHDETEQLDVGGLRQAMGA